MPIAPKGEKPTTSAPTGGSPRGWSFIGSAKCWRRWALKHLVGVRPATTKDYFALGSAYHALMEGQTDATVRAAYPDQYEQAKELHQTRMKKGPPLGKALAVEAEHAIFGGLMTSKPDREEQGLIRDYKTAMMFSDNDDAAWNVDPGILGECVAANVERASVDIISKRVDASKRVKLVEVTLTETKRHALEVLVNDFWEQVEYRVKKAAGKDPKLAANAFPMNLGDCVGKYGQCEFYARCHGRPPESLLYKVAEEPPRTWLTGRKDSPLPMPGGLSVNLVEKAATRVKNALGMGRHKKSDESA
jgi:hypothetical protein